MNLETKIRETLLKKGFSERTLINNRGLIAATIIEVENIIKTTRE